MNILYITHCSSLYGANKSMLELIINMKKTYNITPIVITPDKGELNDKLDQLKIENHIIRFLWWVDLKNNNKFKNRIKNFRYKIFNSISEKNIASIISNKKIDIIHTNSSTIDIGARVSKRCEIPHIWHIREFGEEDYNLVYYEGIENASKYMETSSSKIICISNAIKNKYEKFLKEKDKLELIYNGVNKEDYFIEISNKDFDNKFNIVFTGCISKEKNQLELIKALDILINREGLKDIKAYFLGDGNTEYMNHLKKYVKDRKLDKNIYFEGKVSNVNTYIEKSHVGVISSVKEAFGRVTVEYMLGGLCVIACDTGANIELISHNKDGIIYKFGESEDLARKIKKVYIDREKLKKISINGQNKALSEFISDVNCDNILELYKKVNQQVYSNLS